MGEVVESKSKLISPILKHLIVFLLLIGFLSGLFWGLYSLAYWYEQRVEASKIRFTGAIEDVREEYTAQGLFGSSSVTKYIVVGGKTLELNPSFNKLDFLITGQSVTVETLKNEVTKITISK